MKVMTNKEFAKMPAGTVFAPFKPMICDEIMIKEDGGEEIRYRDGLKMVKAWMWNGATNLIPDLSYIEDLYDDNIKDNEDYWKQITHCLNEEKNYYVGTTKETENSCWDCSNADYCDDDLFIVFEKYEVERMIKMLQEALMQQENAE